MCNNCLNFFLLVFVKKDIVLTMVYFFLELSWRNQGPSADPNLIFFWDDLLPSTRENLQTDLGTILSLNIGKSVLPLEMLLSVMESIVIFVHIQ